jgi:hypothetical protein
VTPDQGRQLSNIEHFINKQLERDQIEGFQAVRPRAPKGPAAPSEPAKPRFGRRVKKYSNRL